MFRLGPNDYARTVEFLRELYAQTDAAQFPHTLLSGLARLIPCENLGYNDIHPKSNTTLLIVHPFSTRILELMPRLVEHFHEHPQLAFYRENADRGVYQTEDFISHRQYRQKGIYREFYRHIDADHQLTVLLSEQGEPSDIGIGINRRKKPFNERDRAVLTLLRPHLAQARANALAFTAAERRTVALAYSLVALSASVVLLKTDGHVDWFTPRAMELLEHYFPGAARHASQLPEPLARWWRQQQTHANSANAFSAIYKSFVQAMPGGRLTVRCQTGADGSHRLLLTEERALSPIDHAKNFGITPREAEVLHWLAEGKNNPEIAGILHISPRTVHKHMEHLFHKLGVETRHAAMLKVMEWKQG
jgi:DNA-binding CsgD family transcriptional regulator